ncbi:hypothetical protein [Sphaerochaeta sp. PS]|uniref:hypothetical protein n=1 Tax=Sphaerochaeta sp. PS TaxID=3076336 RepID=UPI0028A4AF9B|nr:hypothetical protein [Sphaerochaeta sp. PS]MDT4761461.1 hypothetical protein [Sphaerochaeta sp. PS]
MKMKLTLLLLVSVFFCLLVSCGMPTILSLNSWEYVLANTPITPVTNLVQGTFKMDVDPGVTFDLLNTNTKGPSLMFFYTIDDGTEADYTLNATDLNSFITGFASTYTKNGYEGIPVTGSKELVTIKSYSQNKDVYLYALSGKGAGATFNASDQYVLYATSDANNAELTSFTLTKTDEPSPGTGFSLELARTSPGSSPPFSVNATKLYDYEGNPFLQTRSDILAKKDSSNHEYDFTGDSPSTIRIHLFVAFFLEKPNTNNFWSRLVYLDAIPICPLIVSL